VSYLRTRRVIINIPYAAGFHRRGTEQLGPRRTVPPPHLRWIKLAWPFMDTFVAEG
jgi:hypothetical protein